MGASLQTSICDCFEKSHKTKFPESQTDPINDMNITLTSKTKPKTVKFAKENGLTTNVAQKIKQHRMLF